MLEEMKMNIEVIVTKNRAVLHRMRDLNVRAGSDVFPIPEREDLNRRFASALQGARRVAEITNFEALRLPQPDESLVTNILTKCPDTIDVLGRQVEVEYRPPYYGSPRAPRVQIDFRYMAVDDWNKFPDSGVYLPDGREVTVIATVGEHGYAVEASSSQFKEKARERLNQGLWEQWSQPELPSPTSSIPQIEEREYGQCVVTKVPLIAFGTVKYDSWYGSWKSYWSRDRAEVEQMREQSRRQFAEVQEKIVREALKKQIGELYNLHRETVPEGLRNRMYHAVNGYSPQSVADMEVIIAEVEDVLKPKTETDLTQIDMSKLFGGAAKVR